MASKTVQNPKTETRTSTSKKGDDSSKDKAFTDECMALTNKYRALHQAAPLAYNQDLERFARQWAEHLSKSGSFMHNPQPVLNGKELGENIASRWSSDHEPISALQTVNQWYSEIERYDFKANAGPNTGHFTQVVWKDSKETGLWRTQVKDGTWIVVAYYYPAGNYVGEYAENVVPSKDGKFGHQIGKQSISQGAQSRHSAGGGGGGGGVAAQKGNVSKTVKTQTVTHHDGSVTTTVIETTKGPGPETRTKTVVTTKKPDGSTTTDTTEKLELGPSK